MAEKLSILIETVFKGKGAKDASKSLAALEKSTSKTKVAQAALAQSSQKLSNTLSKLGADVASGNKSIDEATTAYKKAAAEHKKLERQLKGSSEAADKSQSSFASLKSTYAQFAVGAAAAAVALKQVWDVAKQGEILNQSADRFDALTRSIGGAIPVLESLRAVTRGQATDAALMASSNQLLSMGLADTSGELENHFRIVSALKKPNEDLASALENWSLMLANQSIPRLDSFGISSGKVRDRIKELKAANEGMNREQAFMIATMEQAEAAVNNLGGAVTESVNSYAQLETIIGNVTDSAKSSASEGLEPYVAGLVGIAHAADEASDELQAFLNIKAPEGSFLRDKGLLEQSFDKNIGAMGRFAKGFLKLAGIWDEANTKQKAAMRESGRIADEAGEAHLNFLKALKDGPQAATGFGETIAWTGEQIRAYSAASADARGKEDEFADKLLQTEKQLSDNEIAVRKGNDAYRQSVEDKKAATAAGEEEAQALEKTAAAADEAAEAYRELQRAQEDASGDAFIDALENQEDLLRKIQTTGTQGFIPPSTIDDINNLTLAQLDAEKAGIRLEAARQALTKGASDNKSLLQLKADVINAEEAFDNASGAVERLGGLIHDGKTFTREYGDDIRENLVGALLESADAAGVGAAGLALLKGAVGDIAPEMIEAALELAAVQTKIGEMGPLIATAIEQGVDPSAAIDAALTQIDAFVRELEGKPPLEPPVIPPPEFDFEQMDVDTADFFKGLEAPDAVTIPAPEIDFSDTNVNELFSNIEPPELPVTIDTDGAGTTIDEFFGGLEPPEVDFIISTDKTDEPLAAFETELERVMGATSPHPLEMSTDTANEQVGELETEIKRAAGGDTAHPLELSIDAAGEKVSALETRIHEAVGVQDPHDLLIDTGPATNSVNALGSTIASLFANPRTLYVDVVMRGDTAPAGATGEGYAQGGFTGGTGGFVHPNELVLPPSIWQAGLGAIGGFADKHLPGGLPGGDSGSTIVNAPTTIINHNVSQAAAAVAMAHAQRMRRKRINDYMA